MFFTVRILIKMEAAKSERERGCRFSVSYSSELAPKLPPLQMLQDKTIFADKQSLSRDLRQQHKSAYARVQSLQILLYLHCSILWPTLNGFPALTARRAGWNDTARHAGSSLSLPEQRKMRATALLFAISEQRCAPATAHTPLGNISWTLQHHKRGWSSVFVPKVPTSANGPP